MAYRREPPEQGAVLVAEGSLASMGELGTRGVTGGPAEGQGVYDPADPGDCPPERIWIGLRAPLDE